VTPSHERGGRPLDPSGDSRARSPTRDRPHEESVRGEGAEAAVCRAAGAVVVALAVVPRRAAHKLAGLLAVAIGIGAASALANNLPVSASASALLAAGPAAYAATIGLAVGALATPQGSVATLIATDLAGPNAPPLPLRRLAPVAGAAVFVATLLLWTTL